ncbi:MAG: hypothetical protein L6420_07955 [Elusimicrobia bacterium]|nr:hypothetical protein [Elusimicrobiota bacterium]
MLQRDSDTGDSDIEQQKTARQCGSVTVRQRYRTTENSATVQQRDSDTEQQKIARQCNSAAAIQNNRK